MFVRNILAALMAAATAQAIYAGNVFVVPASNNTSATVTVSVYSSDTFTQVNSFAAPQPIGVFTTPTGSKHYVVTTGGADTLMVLDGSNYTVLKRFNFGSAATAGAMTGNGSRVLAVGGQSLNILDTTSDNVISSTLDVGSSPIDVSVSLDSTRAFVLSSASNRLSVIDLSNNSVLKTIPVPGPSTGVATGPSSSARSSSPPSSAARRLIEMSTEMSTATCG